MAGKIEARLQALSIDLPEAASPAANYIPYVITGNLIFVSGQLPFMNGALPGVGKVGRDLTVEEAREAFERVARDYGWRL